MVRYEKRFSLILLVIAALLNFGFTLYNDTFVPMKEKDSSLFLHSLYAVFDSNDTVFLSFSERVWIPFLEKWSEMNGKGIYLLNSKKFRLEMKNSTSDIYVSNGDTLHYETEENGKRIRKEFELEDDSLTYIIPSKKKWEQFHKEVFMSSGGIVLVKIKPMDKNFPFSSIEFLIDEKNFKLKEVVFTGTDGRILHFRIESYRKKKVTEEKLKKYFSL